jgi:hypothetical protein
MTAHSSATEQRQTLAFRIQAALDASPNQQVLVSRQLLEQLHEALRSEMATPTLGEAIEAGGKITGISARSAIRAPEQDWNAHEHARVMIPVDVLREHWLHAIECDHEKKVDRPICACSKVNLGWHASVGLAVETWLMHLQGVVNESAVSEIATKEHSVVHSAKGLDQSPPAILSASSLTEDAGALAGVNDKKFIDRLLCKPGDALTGQEISRLLWMAAAMQERLSTRSSIAPSEANEIIEWCIRILAKHYRESRFDPEESRLVLSKAVGELRRALKMQDQEAPRSATAAMEWISVEDRMPPDETPVLIVRMGEVRIGELRWERPTFEETFKAFRYWDDPLNDGQTWDSPGEITHWMPLPINPVDRTGA